MAYVDACSDLARAVGSAASLGPGSFVDSKSLGQSSENSSRLVLDIGCGCGASLVLWRREFAQDAGIVGVNCTQAECNSAEEAIRGEGNIKVLCEDALDTVHRGEDFFSDVQTVVSVDALYHVHTRRELLYKLARVMRPGSSFAAADILGSCDLWKPDEKYSGFLGWWQLWWRAPVHVSLITVISACAGVPLENLLYSKASLNEVVAGIGGNDCIKLENFQAADISDHVFVPFSTHMWHKGLRAIRQGDIFRAFNLWGAAAFMRWMMWTGTVEMVLYRWQMPQRGS